MWVTILWKQRLKSYFCIYSAYYWFNPLMATYNINACTAVWDHLQHWALIIDGWTVTFGGKGSERVRSQILTISNVTNQPSTSSVLSSEWRHSLTSHSTHNRSFRWRSQRINFILSVHHRHHYQQSLVVYTLYRKIGREHKWVIYSAKVGCRRLYDEVRLLEECRTLGCVYLCWLFAGYNWHNETF